MRRSSLAFALVFGLASACGGSDTPADTGPAQDAAAQDASPPDNGVPEPLDMGTPDTGPEDTGAVDMGFDCSMNPNMCAPMQLLDDECRCRPECEGDFRWNAVTMMCDPPPAGQCAVDMDCPSRDDVCLNPPQGAGQAFAPCMGEATCQCFTGCNPFVGPTRTGCPVGMNGQPQACAHLLTSGLNADAVCVAPGMGRLQGQACNQLLSCNRNSNHFCIGFTQTSTRTGVCQRLCDRADDAFCEAQGTGLVCAPANVAGFPNLGLCGNPPTPATDFGTACTDNAQCTGLCSQLLGGCSANCRPPNSCGTGSVCINFNAGAPPGEESLCMVECPTADAAGDMVCQMRNRNWICRDLTGGTPLCSPPCNVIGCPPMLMCNPMTGRCE